MKWKPKWGHKLAQKVQKMCSICRLLMVVLPIFITQKYYFALNLSSTGCSLMGLLFASEEQKKFGWLCNVRLCHECHPTLPGTGWQHLQLCVFRSFQTLVFNRLDHKLNRKLLWVYLKKIPSLLVESVMRLHLRSPFWWNSAQSVWAAFLVFFLHSFTL